MNNRDERAKSIFLSAVELDSTEKQSAYLDEQCGDDGELRQEVEELLRHQEQMGSFLETCPADSSAGVDPRSSERPGTKFGPYTLLEKLGEGGMGAVYLAEQSEPVERRVALKIIKQGMDTRQVISRFEAERQALALMDHPNIARVFDAGITDSGRPYFVMELVKGVPITEYCDVHRLDPRQRLKLFIDVCHAVQHAHQKGIIHRDLKPANILVAQFDDEALPKIIDFGVAKATQQRLTDKTMVTEVGMVVGTLEYMSPEQAELKQLDVDTRTDVYSLGVILYELLTGHAPLNRHRFQSASLAEMLRIIREEEPPKPSARLSSSESLPSAAANRHVEPHKLTSTVRGELDWIVMKAIEKDRERRYESASAFAVDIERYLIGDAVQACPPSRTYRLRKFARRNRALLTTTALVAAALLVGTGVSLWQAIDARRARNEAVNAAEREREQRQLAEENFRQAREAVDTYLTKVSEDQLLGAPSMQPLRKELLELALGYYQGFVAQHPDDSDLQDELADAHYRVGKITREIGSATETLQAHQLALEIREKLVGRDPANQFYQQDLASSKQALAVSLVDIGKTDESVALFRDAIAIRERLVEQNPEAAEYQSDLAKSYNNMAYVHARTGQINKALTLHRKAVALSEQLVEQAPDITEYQKHLATHYNNIASMQVNSVRTEESASFHRKAIAIREKLVEQHPEDLKSQSSLATSFSNLAIVQRAMGQTDEALTLFRQAIAIHEKLVEQNPKVLEYKSRLAGAYNKVANLLVAMGQTDEAQELLEKAITIQESLLEQNPNVAGYLSALARSYQNLAILHQRSGQGDAAEIAQGKAITAFETLVEQNPENKKFESSLTEAYLNQSVTYAGLGQVDRAIEILDKAVSIQARLANETPDKTRNQQILAGSYYYLAQMHFSLGDTGKSVALSQKSITIEEALVERHPENVNFQRSLALAYVSQALPRESLDQFDEALTLARKGITILERLYEQNPSFVRDRELLAESYGVLGSIHHSRGDQQAADTVWKKLIGLSSDLDQREISPMHLGHLGQAHYRLGNWQKAREAMENANEVGKAKQPTSVGGPRWWYLTMALHKLGEVEQARTYYDRLVKELEVIRPAEYDSSKYLAEAAAILGIEESAHELEETPTVDRSKQSEND